MSFQLLLEFCQGFCIQGSIAKILPQVMLLRSGPIVEVWLHMLEVQPEEHGNHKGLDETLWSMLDVMKGLIFLMLCSANLHDRALLAIWSFIYSISALLSFVVIKI